MKILIADDDVSVCLYLENILKKNNYQLITCHNGNDAWDIIKTQNINLLVTDWMMPGLSGIELCEKIRKTGRASNYIYIILLTGKNNSNDILDGYKAGADDFISKPVLSSELNVRIKTGERLIKLEEGLLQKNKLLEAAKEKIQTNYLYIKNSLDAAAKIQRTLLPFSSETNLPVELCWEFKPADELAGDLFNFYPLDDSHLALYLIDVVGHGVPAAMLSVYLNKILSPLKSNDNLIYNSNSENGFRTPAEITHLLNQKFQQGSFHQQNNELLYFTMVYAIINTTTGHGNLCQAGHPYPLLARKNGDVDTLGAGGHPVGLFDDSNYQDIPFVLNPGDRFFLYSDAVTECSNRHDDAYGLQQLHENVSQIYKQSLKQTIENIVRSMEKWHEVGLSKDGFDDDLSILALELQTSVTSNIGNFKQNKLI
ncbi:MAG: SpoIIE family protein phosphatase [Pseudomonadota bacterium]